MMSAALNILNGMSVDLEEAFHASAFEGEVSSADWEALPWRAEAQVKTLLELFGSYEVKATFFTLGWMGQHQPSLVRRVASMGHELGCHGFSHARLTGQSLEAFKSDVSRAKHLLEDLSGQPVLGYRAPTFSLMKSTRAALEVLVELGFTYDSSIFPVHHDRYGWPGAPRFPYRLLLPSGATLLEVPPSSVPIAHFNLPVAGGGYLRLYPFFLSRAAFCWLNEYEGQPGVVYVHPWDLDAGQPRLTKRRLSWWRHQHGAGSVRHRLEVLMQHHRFSSLEALLKASYALPTWRLTDDGRLLRVPDAVASEEGDDGNASGLMSRASLYRTYIRQSPLVNEKEAPRD